MAQKSKAASLTPDLLTSKGAPAQPAPRKQATDLSLAPPPKASPPEPAKAAASAPPPTSESAPASASAPAPAKAKSKAKSKARDIEPARESEIDRKPDDAPTAPAQSAAAEAPPSKAAAVAATGPVEPSGGDGKAVVAAEQPTADPNSDYRIRIPVPLDPSEHLELTLAAARSGRSCQDIIVEALFRYLEDIAGPPDRPAAPGPEGQR